MKLISLLLLHYRSSSNIFYFFFFFLSLMFSLRQFFNPGKDCTLDMNRVSRIECCNGNGVSTVAIRVRLETDNPPGCSVELEDECLWLYSTLVQRFSMLG